MKALVIVPASIVGAFGFVLVLGAITVVGWACEARQT